MIYFDLNEKVQAPQNEVVSVVQKKQRKFRIHSWKGISRQFVIRY